MKAHPEVGATIDLVLFHPVHSQLTESLGERHPPHVIEIANSVRSGVREGSLAVGITVSCEEG